MHATTLPVLRRLLLRPALLLIVVACAACGTPGNDPPASVSSTAATTDQDPFTRFEENLHGWTVVSDEINAVLATPDLGVGEQRFSLVLSDDEGLIKFPVVEFTLFKYKNGFDKERGDAVDTALARFNEFPYGTRGAYVTNFTFDAPGAWSVEAAVPRANGDYQHVEVRFAVYERPMSVAVGDLAPPSNNRTLNTVGNITELTTGSLFDEELYRFSIADAIGRERPFVVVFASPAFCTNAVCGPQVEVLSELREQYADRADFIHIDLFENPSEIQGDLSRAIETPLLDEWRLVSQEWTFVVGADGRVAARFENFVGVAELSEALESALETAHNA